MVSRVLVLTSLLFGSLVASHPLRQLRETDPKDGGGCSACVSLGDQGLNILLNYVLQAGVVGGCGKLCSHLTSKAEVTACNLLCDIVGIKEFAKVLNSTDLDTIYFCEELKVCTPGSDDAAVTLGQASAVPSTVVKGSNVDLTVALDVVKNSGVGQFLIAVNGPVTVPVAQGFLLPTGLSSSDKSLAVQLAIQDDESGDQPLVWSPGLYTFEFHVCQGECDSKHPHSKDFGRASGSFNLTEAFFANPTHYGDPKTGCESDEMAVQVMGLSGDFCSPKCNSAGTCPSDVPSGDTATPTCALRTSTGDKYCALLCQADADCGTGTCQHISGVGICTYATSNKVGLPKLQIEAPKALALFANPTHYGDPKTGCESDEMAVQVMGLSGDFCSPKCNSAGTCPSDVPSGDTATPTCALRTSTGDKYCALLCQADADCGTGSCQHISGVGICTYSTSKKGSMVALFEIAKARKAVPELFI